MKKKYLIIFLLSTIAVILLIFFTQPSNVQTKYKYSVAQQTEIKHEIAASSALLIDVRNTEEFNEIHALNAINLPYDKIQSGSHPTEDKDMKIYLYCRTGIRASAALKSLTDAGYTNVTNLGGLEDWMTKP